MRCLVALLACMVLGHAAAAEPQAVAESPAWSFVGKHSYEETNPGLGTSERFSSSAGWIDVYTYGMQRDDWAAGLGDRQFDREFDDVLASVRQAGAQGVFVRLQVGATHDVTIGGQPFRVATFGFELRGQPSESAAYLTARGGQLLKYRVTVKAGTVPSLTQLSEAFIARDLANRPKTGR